MKSGVPPTYRSPCGDHLAVSWRPRSWVAVTTLGAGLLLPGSPFTLTLADSALRSVTSGPRSQAE